MLVFPDNKEQRIHILEVLIYNRNNELTSVINQLRRNVSSISVNRAYYGGR